jgi:hypothetical protein
VAIEDHRVSDSFVREYSWRQRFSSDDPEWLMAHDLPAARDADRLYAEAMAERQRLEADMNALRDRIEASRRLTRILVTADPQLLSALAQELLLAFGASVPPAGTPPLGVRLLDPGNGEFLLLTLTQQGSIRAFHVDLLLSRIARIDTRKLIVTNANVTADVDVRPPDLEPALVESVLATGASVISARELYRLYTTPDSGGDVAALWSALGRVADIHALQPTSFGAER